MRKNLLTTIASMAILGGVALLGALPLHAGDQATKRRAALSPERQAALSQTLQVQRLERSMISHYGKLRMPSAAASTTSNLQSSGNDAQFLAFLGYSSAWSSSANLCGFYSIAPGNNSYESVFLTPGVQINAGGAIYDGKFHGMSFDNSFIGTYYEYNISDWTPTENSGTKVYNYAFWGTSSAYDATSGLTYLCSMNDDFDYILAAIDYADLDDYTEIKVFDGYNTYAAMAFDAEGQLWAITAIGDLVKVNKYTGQETLVGSTGVKPSTDFESAAFDQKTGKLYWAAVTYDENDSHLYEVDTTTGQATVLSSYPNSEAFYFLHITSAADNNAPAAIDDLAAVFEGESLAGNIKFTMPSKTVAGSDISGTVDYAITDNGTALATGQAEAGSAVSAPVEVAAGRHVFGVTLSFNGVEGTENTVQTWVGKDAPKAPANAALAIEGNSATVNWTAPAEGANGGFINPSTLTYNVVRYPGAVTVATGITATTFAEILPQGEYTAYYYEVVANNAGSLSEAATTNYVCAGDPICNLPYSSNFSDITKAYIFDIVDNDGDGISWQYDGDLQALTYFSMYTDYTEMPDDWIVTPPFALKADRQYIVSYDARCYSESDREHLRLAIADANLDDVSEFKTLDDDRTIHTISFKTFDQLLTVDADGNYRFGIRALENTGLAVFVRNITLREGCKLAAPAEVSNLAITPNATGALKAKVAFTAPSTTIAGTTLASIDRVEIYAGSATEPVKVLTDVTPSAECTADLLLTDKGNITFRVVAYNEAGVGAEATATAYVGTDTLSWDAVASEGVNGGYVNPADVTYNVYSVNENVPSLLTSGVAATSYNVDIDLNGSQYLVYYALKAVNGDLLSDYGVSSMLVAGKPYNLPYKESFPKGYRTSYWAVRQYAGEGYFQTITSNSSDNDGGAMFYASQEQGDECLLNSGKISLSGAVSPFLIFDYYSVPGSGHTIAVSVRANGGAEQVVGNIEMSDKEGWQRASIDLRQFVGFKYIILGFDAVIGNASSGIIIDNINVCDLYDYDLKASIEAPAVATAGSEAQVKVVVENVGLNAMTGYTVQLLADGKVVSEQKSKLQKIAFGETEAFDFNYKVAPNAGESLELSARVAHDYDMDETNNEAQASVRVVASTLPAVSDLTASTEADGSVALTWTAVNAAKNQITDDFEAYDAWATSNVGKWLLVDGDGYYTYGSGNSFPGISSPMAYIVFNPNAVGDGSDYAPHSGEQYMAAFSAPNGAVDDWIISPELSGDAQTISFFIRSLNDYYGLEEYQVLYSTKGRDIADFTVVQSTQEAPEEWTEVRIDLPQGARYFAIRCVSNDHTMMMVDDVTYTAPTPEIVGYNVYRNGELIATTETASYIDHESTAGGEYNVTAVFTEGESAFSNTASASTSVTEIAAEGASVGTDANGIVINNAAEMPVKVFSASGVVIYSGLGTDELHIAVAHGIYLVTIGNKAFKIMK